MENIGAFMVGVLYLVLIYELFLCVKQKVIKTDHKELQTSVLENAPTTRTRKDLARLKSYPGRMAPMPAYGAVRANKSNSSRRFIQMRILGGR